MRSPPSAAFRTSVRLVGMPQLIYIRMSEDERLQLWRMAEEERRSVQDQAAYLVVQGLLRWKTRKDFEASLPPMAGEDEEVPAA